LYIIGTFRLICFDATALNTRGRYCIMALCGKSVSKEMLNVEFGQRNIQ